jgi:hypothetical protein
VDILHRLLEDLWDIMPRKDRHVRSTCCWELMKVEQRFTRTFLDVHMSQCYIAGLLRSTRSTDRFELYFPTSSASFEGRNQGWSSMTYLDAFNDFRAKYGICMTHVLKTHLRARFFKIEVLPQSSKDKVWKTDKVKGKDETHLFWILNVERKNSASV